MSETLAILGCGKMGETLAAGLLESGWRNPDEIVVTARREERVRELAGRYGCRATTSNSEALRDARILVISVKPQDMETLLGEIASDVGPEHLILTIAAGIPTLFIEKRIPAEVPVVRAMPNIPSQVRQGVAAICPGSHAGDEHLEVAEEVLSHVGGVVRLPEIYMDAVTAVSGSGPAYFAFMAEAMIDAGVALGLSPSVSTELVVQTLVGTGMLLRDAGMHPAELREAVTSPGGTTIMAIRELERAGVRAAILEAIQAAAERSRELAERH